MVKLEAASRLQTNAGAFKAPKAIVNHPGVEECEDGPSNGAPEYKYDIFLKEGWEFTNGRTAGCRSLLCNTVSEFRYANPQQVTHG